MVSPIIKPDECCFPIELSCGRQGEAVLAQIGRVLAWVEIELHTLS